METVLSKTGIEVSYSCTIHLLHNGENFECDYKSDHTGRDLLCYICRVQKIEEIDYWGLKFMDTAGMDEQRHWLDLDKLIRPQVKNISPIRFYFRVKVYPPEPYKIQDQAVRHPLYQQLRLDLLGGRLFCDINEAAMLVALILQHVHGDFTRNLAWMYVMYIKSKILRKERCPLLFFNSTQRRALEIYQKLLVGLDQLEVEDMFLRMASKLDSYGVEPFLMRTIDKLEVILWMNFKGIKLFDKKKKTLHLTWRNITKITHAEKNLFVHPSYGGVMVFECVNHSECNYIWSTALAHLIYFTTITYETVGINVDTQIFTSKPKTASEKSFFNNNLLRLIDFNSLVLFYALAFLYVTGSHTAIFGHLKNFLYNKILTL